MPETKALRDELLFHLNVGHAHASFEDVVVKFPEKLRGEVPGGMQYSAWQLLEHMRIAQDDILQFSTNERGHYKPLKWPGAYWPKKPQPASPEAWQLSVDQFLKDRQEMAEAIADEKRDLFTPFPWGDGQTLLREALVLIDHNSHHLGQLITLRRLLNCWPPER